jgi:hypothetical protein
MAGDSLQRSLLWSRVGAPGSEYFALWQETGGWRLEGHVVTTAEAVPLWVSYEVRCDPAWRTREVQVRMVAEGRTTDLRLESEGHGAWRREGGDCPAVRGCLDADLSVSPSTNTLPIRRLDLRVGESADVVAAWVRLPSLAVEPLPQRYTRVGEREYRYESHGGAFTALLAVDELGLVTHYPGGWQRA